MSSSARRRLRGAAVLLLLALAAAPPLALNAACGAKGEQRPRRAEGTASGSTITVAAGEDLQKAIERARPGDTINVEAGASFEGPFTLTDKGAGEQYITIQSSAATRLAAGARVGPAQSALMPKLLTAGRGEPALRTAPGAHHWRLVGLEIAQRDAAAQLYDLVKLGDGSAAQSKLSDVPHHFVIERCYIHAAPDGQLKRGVALNSAATEILDSYISGFKVKGQDASAIGGWNGPGPYRIVNNHIESAGVTVHFGGAAGGLNVVPSDIEFTRNTVTRPPEWRGVYTVKNLFELKNARRVTVSGNLFEHNWVDAQAGYAILFTPRPNDSNDAALVEDVSFTNNVVRGTAAGVNVIGSDPLYERAPSEVRGRRIQIRNNLFADVGGQWGGDGVFIKLGEGAESVTVDHNTVLNTGNITKASGAPLRSFSFTNNVVAHNDYGVHGDDAAVGLGAINRYFPGSTWSRNAIVGAQPPTGPFADPESRYPPGNFFPRRWDDVKMVDRAGGDYRLAPDSPFRHRAADGKDVGCDFDELLEKTGAPSLQALLRTAN
ncbi:MAG: right-handed parallel beta-helix repeat-containing protein [Acidobacteria bacterium]|nr:right-handed parallel beta-helix repeat-containing protein [Acidobacteriota bacterium]